MFIELLLSWVYLFAYMALFTVVCFIALEAARYAQRPPELPSTLERLAERIS